MKFVSSIRLGRLLGLVLLFTGVLLFNTSIFAQEPAATEEAEDSSGGDGAQMPTFDDPVVERGFYLFRIAGACIHCHAEGGPDALDQPDADIYTIAASGGYAWLTGNLATEEPWGTVYASNLTVLGDWSDEAIENAIRYGVRADGTVLLPPMPYEAYAGMSDDDMTALIAYIRTLEPVENEIPEAELNEGLTREGLRQPPDMTADMAHEALPADASPEERGQYLVQHVSACVHCHGSVTPEGLIDVEGPLVGATLIYSPFGAFGAPNITAGELSEWADEQIIGVFNGTKPDGDPVFFMPTRAFRHMTDDDKAAIIAWLRSQP